MPNNIPIHGGVCEHCNFDGHWMGSTVCPQCKIAPEWDPPMKTYEPVQSAYMIAGGISRDNSIELYKEIDAIKEDLKNIKSLLRSLLNEV